MVNLKWLAAGKKTDFDRSQKFNSLGLPFKSQIPELIVVIAGIALLIYMESPVSAIIIYIMVPGILYCRWLNESKKSKVLQFHDKKVEQKN